MNDDEVECGGCEDTEDFDEAIGNGWILDAKLNDGTESGMSLCPNCAVRYLDIDDRLPIQTYETIRKIQTTI
jgi:hypothetical protein